MRKKRDHEKAVRVTISMPPELWEIASDYKKRRKLATFSDSIQDLIRNNCLPAAHAA